MCASTINELVPLVQGVIDTGWRPLGSPFVTPEGAYAQALVLA